MAIKISGSTIIDDSRNIVNAGIITASSFSGDGTGLTGVGIGSTDSINTSGIITASTISANEFIGTGDKLIFSPTVTSFSPTQGETDVSLGSNISLTFDQPIYAGVGTITLRYSSGIGTIIESIGIGSTSQITISNQTLTIDPSSSLPIGTSVYVVLPQGVVTNAVSGGNALLDTYNFTTIDFQLSSIDPSDGATNVGLDTNITLSFTSAPTRGTGTIELKSGSVDGPIIESFDAASSPRISVSGNDWILDPTSNLGYGVTAVPVIPSTAISGYAGLNTTGASSYSFDTDIGLGQSQDGGILICRSGGIKWILAPSSSDVTRTWYSRNDAVTTAQSVSGCTGWFVPTCGQLQNPGYTCRTYWDVICGCFGAGNGFYWSNSEDSGFAAWGVSVCNNNTFNSSKTYAIGVRAFRCVSY